MNFNSYKLEKKVLKIDTSESGKKEIIIENKSNGFKHSNQMIKIKYKILVCGMETIESLEKELSLSLNINEQLKGQVIQNPRPSGQYALMMKDLRTHFEVNFTNPLTNPICFID